MASETDDPDAAADRLEAALERIAQAGDARRTANPGSAPPPCMPKKLLRDSTG